MTSSVTTRRPVCSTSWWRPPADQLPLPAPSSVACNVIILASVCLRFLRQDFKVANKTWKIICDRQEGAQVLLATVRRTYHYQSIPSSGPALHLCSGSMFCNTAATAGQWISPRWPPLSSVPVHLLEQETSSFQEQHFNWFECLLACVSLFKLIPNSHRIH